MLRKKQAMLAQNTTVSWSYLHFIRAWIFKLKKMNLFESKISGPLQWLEENSSYFPLLVARPSKCLKSYNVGSCLTYIPVQHLRGGIHSILECYDFRVSKFPLTSQQLCIILFYQWRNGLLFQHSYAIYDFPGKLFAIIFRNKRDCRTAPLLKYSTWFLRLPFSGNRNICMKGTVLWTHQSVLKKAPQFEGTARTFNCKQVSEPTPDPGMVISRSSEPQPGEWRFVNQAPLAPQSSWDPLQPVKGLNWFLFLLKHLWKIPGEQERANITGRTCPSLSSLDRSLEACLSFSCKLRGAGGSVMSSISSSLRHYGSLWSTRLCPWDFPGKNTGVGCHALFQGIFPTRDNTPISCVSCIGMQILYCWGTWEVWNPVKAL